MRNRKFIRISSNEIPRSPESSFKGKKGKKRRFPFNVPIFPRIRFLHELVITSCRGTCKFSAIYLRKPRTHKFGTGILFSFLFSFQLLFTIMSCYRGCVKRGLD